MKKCPTCQKTFDDDKRFCQIDGTPLVADTVENADANDPYKTVFGGQAFNPSPNAPGDLPKAADAKRDEEEVLQIPEAFDPMKTMVVSDIKNEIPKSEPPARQPEPPKFNEPNLSPPNFGDLSSLPKEPPKQSEPPKFDPPFPPAESPKFDSPFDKPADFPKSPASPFNEPPKFGSPFSQTENEPPKFDSPFEKKFDSPFEKKEEPAYDKPKDNPFPPFKDSTAPLGEKKDPFQSSAFGLPPTPLEKSYNPPSPAFDPPPVQNTDWNPPPAPADNWANQEIGSNTPFNPPPAGTAGQNQTLAIVSLVLGIISIPCCGFVLFGVGAAVTGFLAKKKAEENPAEYGGRGLALAGMIIGAITAVLGLILTILQLFFGVLGSMGNL